MGTNINAAPDWTDYDKLAKQVVGSRSYDNGMPCTGEQAIHLPADKVEQMKAAFVKQGAYILSDEDAKKRPGIPILPMQQRIPDVPVRTDRQDVPSGPSGSRPLRKSIPHTDIFWCYPAGKSNPASNPAPYFQTRHPPVQM